MTTGWINKNEIVSNNLIYIWPSPSFGPPCMLFRSLVILYLENKCHAMDCKLAFNWWWAGEISLTLAFVSAQTYMYMVENPWTQIMGDERNMSPSNVCQKRGKTAKNPNWEFYHSSPKPEQRFAPLGKSFEYWREFSWKSFFIYLFYFDHLSRACSHKCNVSKVQLMTGHEDFLIPLNFQTFWK